jgi:hypothetical protein
MLIVNEKRQLRIKVFKEQNISITFKAVTKEFLFFKRCYLTKLQVVIWLHSHTSVKQGKA